MSFKRYPELSESLDLLARKLVPVNFLSDIDDMKRESKQRDLHTTLLSAASDGTKDGDMGTMVAGRFIAVGGTGSAEPTESDFTGVAIAQPPLEFVIGGTTHYASIVGVNAGVVQFYLSNIDGAIYAAAGAMIIDQNAIQVLGILYTYAHTATSGGETRTLRLGMGLYNNIPAGELVFTGDAGSDVLVNGGFETGTLSNWTPTGEVNGAWGASTSVVYAGSKSAVFTPSGASNTGELYSDRMAVTAGDAYELTGQIYITAGSGAWGDLGAYIEYYDDPTAGSLVDSNSITMPFSPGGWIGFALPGTVPSGAVSARIRFDVGGNATVPLYLDAIAFTEVGVNTALRFLPDPSITGRLQLFENLNAADSDNGYIAILNRHHVPVGVTDGYGLNHFGTRNYRRIFVTTTTTKTTIGTWVIPANSMGDNGHLEIEAYFRMLNNTGVSRNFVIDVDWGAETPFTRTITLGSSANPFGGHFKIRISNSGGPTAQRTLGKIRNTNNVADGAFTGWAQDQQSMNTAAQDTQTDLTLTVSVTPSFSSSSLWLNTLGFNGHGPVELG
jgi:hypothetical protein